MRTVAIIQARMGSTRLPGKVLRPLAGRPVVWHVVDRARRIPSVDDVVVATTQSPADDELAAYLDEADVRVFRGPEEDVLARYAQAATATRAHVVVRITADCPVLSPRQSGRVVARLLQGDCDYASNTIERTYPRGLDTSAFTIETLMRATNAASEAADREHVTTFMRRHTDRFRICSVTDDVDRSSWRWTLDTSDDLRLLSRIYEALWPTAPQFEYQDVVALLEHHPEWLAINSHVQQKTI
jgi:spore coat polysaccharide biosynthesis protein SpsF